MAGLRRILLVEDSEELRDMYHTFLTLRGYEVETARDGNDALVKAAHFQPELVFLDIMMPHKDGLEVLHLLRHDERYNSTHAKIVMLTNLSDSPKISAKLRGDMDGYITKADIVLQDLIEVINSFEY